MTPNFFLAPYTKKTQGEQRVRHGENTTDPGPFHILPLIEVIVVQLTNCILRALVLQFEERRAFQTTYARIELLVGALLFP